MTKEEIRESVIGYLSNKGIKVTSQAQVYILYYHLSQSLGVEPIHNRSKNFYYLAMKNLLARIGNKPEEKNSGFLVSLHEGRKAHIWKGHDTACGLYANGSIAHKNYVVSDQTANPICSLCLNVEKGLAFPAKQRINRVRKPRKPKLPTKPRMDSASFYASDAWKAVRYKALEMNGGACQCCGRTRKHGVVLHVDHIKPRSLHPELELRVDNLQVLCEDCNLGKSNKFSTDWR